MNRFESGIAWDLTTIILRFVVGFFLIFNREAVAEWCIHAFMEGLNAILFN